MAVFFTADTHFGHGGARGLYKRPFASTAEMDSALVENWNRVVGPDDEVWHLGDVALGPSPNRVQALMESLHGRKHLVPGNNDPDGVRGLPCWDRVEPYVELALDGHQLVLCHYAFRSWRNMHRGALNLHGHSHGALSRVPRQFDVGVDCRGFRPVTLAGLLEEIRPAARRRGGG